MILTQGDIELKIEAKICHKHGEHPIITIVRKDNVSVYCCCKAFETECLFEIKVLLKDLVNQAEIEKWKKGFKNNLME